MRISLRSCPTLTDMEFVKKFTLPEFQAKTFQLISTVLVIKTQKNERKWRKLNRWQKFYTAAGSDGSGKFHLMSMIRITYGLKKETHNMRQMVYGILSNRSAMTEIHYTGHYWNNWNIDSYPCGWSCLLRTSLHYRLILKMIASFHFRVVPTHLMQ